MSPLLDLPPEVVLHIMRFARWLGTEPDYASMTVSFQHQKHSTLPDFLTVRLNQPVLGSNVQVTWRMRASGTLLACYPTERARCSIIYVSVLYQTCTGCALRFHQPCYQR